MATVASLFGSQAEATAALDALADSQFDDVEARVFEEVGPNPAQPDIGALPHPGSSFLSGAFDPGASAWFDDLDNETAEFFLQRVRNGGVLVVAEVEDERAEALESSLQELGGQTADEY